MTPDERKELDDNYFYDSTLKLLDILDTYNTKATFFIVTEGFDWYPDCIKEIKDRGHELGYHTHDHPDVSTRKLLKAQLKKSSRFIQKYKPMGFRAPELKFNHRNIDVLQQNGFKYSSSMLSNIREIVYKDGFREYPISLENIFRHKVKITSGLRLKDMFSNIPIGSGFFFGLVKNNLRFFLNKSRHVFIHNWQVIKPEKAFFPDLKFLLKHPFYWPYTVNLFTPLIRLLEKVDFVPVSTFFGLNNDNK